MCVAEKILSRLTGRKDPAASHKAVAIMVDFKDGRGYFMAIPLAPGEGGQIGIFAAGPSASAVLLDNGKLQHRTPGMLPVKARQLRRHVGVWDKGQISGTGRLLVVMDKQLQRVGHTGRAQTPACSIRVRSAGERLAAEGQQVAAPI